MNFEEYRNGKHVEYQNFAVIIASILKSALKNENGEFHLWAIHSRAKSPESLENKLHDRDLIACSNLEVEIKDLAGCRLIFYSNNDVNRFVGSGIVSANFDVDWDNSRIHEPVEETEDADKLYRANHFLVSLKSDRTTLSEYSKYSGLKCEIQIQTILNHAWSETGHDVIYKPLKLVGFGTRQHEEIKRRMARIMNEHLLPAGYEFQKVLHDFKRLSEGKKLFDRDVLQAIESACDNNERFDILERFRDHVVPNYDDISGVFQDILLITSRAIDQARKTDTKAISTPFGEYPGKQAQEIVDVALDVLELIQYGDSEAVFSKLCEFYLSSDSDKEKDRIAKAVTKLAAPNLFIWKQVGAHIQSLLIHKVKSFDEEKLRELQPIVIEVCRGVLDSEVKGTSSTFDAVTLHTGTIVISEELRLARNEALEILQRLYCLVDKECDKRNIIDSFNNAMRIPMQGNRSDTLLVMILENARSIFEFYLTQIVNDQYEVLQELEHDALWVFRHEKKWLEVDNVSHDVVDSAKKLISTIKLYRDSINNDEDYVRYKTLVGFRSVFPESWNNDRYELEGQDDYRAQKVSEYVDSVTSQSANDWLNFIRRCSKTRSDDLATFPVFGQFIRLLSEKKPEISLNYLNEFKDEIAAFLPVFLGGLWKSNRRNEAQVLVDSWVAKRLHLNAIARHYCVNDIPFNEKRFLNILEAAIEVDNTTAVIEIVSSCVAKYDEPNSMPIINIFLDAIMFLTNKKDARWVSSVWFKVENNGFFEALDADQTETILLNLVYYPHVENQVEKILVSIAKKYPRKVAQYFGSRIQFEINHQDDNRDNQPYLERYKAIPFQIHSLSNQLLEIPDELVRMARDWYTQSSQLFTFKGAKLLANIFSSFPETFQDELISLVKTKNLDDIDFVLSILSNYEGETFLHRICREIIIALPEDEKSRLNKVEIVLNSTGVVRGEFGFVEAYKSKKKEIAPWLNDKDPVIRVFTKRYIANLDRQIASYHQRARQDIELRKRDFE